MAGESSTRHTTKLVWFLRIVLTITAMSLGQTVSGPMLNAHAGNTMVGREPGMALPSTLAQGLARASLAAKSPRPSIAPDGSDSGASTRDLFPIEGLLQLLAGGFVLLTALVGYLKVRIPPSPAAHSSGLRLLLLRASAPWDEPTLSNRTTRWPTDWDQIDVRKRYWKTKALKASATLLFGLAAIGVSIYEGFGLLGLAYGLAFTLGGLWHLIKLALVGTAWRKTSLVRASTELHLQGTRQAVVEQCLFALTSIGARLVEVDESTGHMVAATGSFGWGISGEKMVVDVGSDAGATWIVRATSDNLAPGLFDLTRSNRRNIQRFTAQFAASEPQSERGSASTV